MDTNYKFHKDKCNPLLTIHNSSIYHIYMVSYYKQDNIHIDKVIDHIHQNNVHAVYLHHNHLYNKYIYILNYHS